MWSTRSTYTQLAVCCLRHQLLYCIMHIRRCSSLYSDSGIYLIDACILTHGDGRHSTIDFTLVCTQTIWILVTCKYSPEAAPGIHCLGTSRLPKFCPAHILLAPPPLHGITVMSLVLCHFHVTCCSGGARDGHELCFPFAFL